MTSPCNLRLGALLALSVLGSLLWPTARAGEQDRLAAETTAGWVKSPRNPVLGGDLGTCFDVSVLKEADTYRMWFSWRPRNSIALVESRDGIDWSRPVIVLGPNDRTDWEADINRPVVIKDGGLYRMWYTGQARGRSWIGYATSGDGKSWRRESEKPVLSAEAPWEKVAVMCPHVLFDEQAGLYRMWYSGGEQYEPDAIGYATSRDGLVWEKHRSNPIFRPEPVSGLGEGPGDGLPGRAAGRRLRSCSTSASGTGTTPRSAWPARRTASPAGSAIRPTRSSAPAERSGTMMRSTSPLRSSTGRGGCCGTTGGRGGVEQIGLATHDGEDLGF